MTELPTHVDIREVSLRDGLQIEDPIPLSAKLELLDAVVATGVREMEATAFVSPSKVPALADAAELAAELHRFDRHRVLRAGRQPQRRQARHRRGPAFDRIRGVGRRRAQPRQRRPHHRGGHRADRRDRRDRPRQRRHVEVIIATAWDCPFDGPTPPQRVARHRRPRHATAGVDRLAIADTIGTTTPRRVSALIAQVRPMIGDMPLGAHFHNTRGAGLASAYAAVQRGGDPPGRVGRRAGRLPVRARVPAATSPPRIWCTCCATAASTSTSTCRPPSPPPSRATGRRPRPAQRAAARRRPDPGLSANASCQHADAQPRAARPGSHRAGRPETVRRTWFSRHHAGGHHVGRGKNGGGVLPLFRRQGGPAGRVGRVLPARQS